MYFPPPPPHPKKNRYLLSKDELMLMYALVKAAVFEMLLKTVHFLYFKY